MRRVNGLVTDTYAAGAGGVGIITIQALEAAGSHRNCSGPHDLKFSRPIAFVHGSKFIAASSHSIMSYGWKKENKTEIKTMNFKNNTMYSRPLHSALKVSVNRNPPELRSLRLSSKNSLSVLLLLLKFVVRTLPYPAMAGAVVYSMIGKKDTGKTISFEKSCEIFLLSLMYHPKSRPQKLKFGVF